MNCLEVSKNSLLRKSLENMAGLLNTADDLSLQKEAVVHHLCEDVTSEELRQNAFKWCRRCLDGAWRKIEEKQFKIEHIKGGLTNYLYLCSLPDDVESQSGEQRHVLVRIYGEILDNRAKFYEGVIFTLLAERGFGPHLYGVFSSGRIEQYIPARHLTTKELSDPHLSKCNAMKIAKYHSMELPLNKEPTWVWENVEKWMSVAVVACFEDPVHQDLFNQIKKMQLSEEYFRLKSSLEELKSKVVFCHNDTQEGNILLIEKDKQPDVMLIDYEYSSYNYRGFDFGNHFCEWMYDYSNKEFPGYFHRPEDYPTKEQQELFIGQYLRTYNKLMNILPEEPTDKDIQRCIFEANRFALLSHLFWGFWSIVQAQVSSIDFGYLEYAVVRFEAYFRQKRLFWTSS